MSKMLKSNSEKHVCEGRQVAQLANPREKISGGSVCLAEESAGVCVLAKLISYCAIVVRASWNTKGPASAAHVN